MEIESSKSLYILIEYDRQYIYDN